MANADISLLFGVLGEGSLGGESGSLIQSQLNQIVSALNKNPLKVKVGLDTESGGQKSWKSQLQTKLDAVSNSGKFSVEVSKLKLGTGAIADFKSQLNAVINTLNLDKGTSITLTAEGIGEIKRELQQVGSGAQSAEVSVDELKARLKELALTHKQMSGSYTDLVNVTQDTAELEKLRQAYVDYFAYVNELNKNTTGVSKAELDHLYKLRNSLDEIIRLQLERVAATQAEAAAETMQASAVNTNIDTTKNSTAELEKRNALLRRSANLLTQMQAAKKNWSLAKHGKSSAEYQNITDYIKYLTDLRQKFIDGEKTAEEFSAGISQVNADFSRASNAIKLADENTKSLTSRVKGLAEKFATWLSISQVIMLLVRSVKQMVSSVRELDTAMTELRKVTNETEQTYRRFLEDATVRSKALGATLSDTVSATADFARLGNTLEDSASLADAALVYKNVGDGIEEIGDAAESVISTMQAFNVDAKDAMSIVDRFNEVGNNFAISSKGIGDALMRSAAALASANNTLNESIALITAANTTVQDADVVGTTMKTVSMYLRAAKTEAEEAGESTEGMASSVSELRKEILALTGNKVDIQIDESTFKSTYQIMKELAAVWDELTDVSQANILEMVGGKRNSNVVSALLTNFELAEDVLATAADSAGSALKENEKYLESIEGKISIFKATFEEFSNNLISSGLVKVFVELGTAVLNVLNAFEELHLLLPQVASVIAMIKAVSAGLAAMRAASAATEATSTVNTLVAQLIAEKTATDTLAVSVANLTVAQKNQLATEIQAAVVKGQLTQVEAGQILTTLGLATAEGALTVANKTLAASFKALMASIPVWGWIALGISVLITAITSLASGIKSSEEKMSELNTELEELNNTVSTTASEFSSLKKSVDDIIPRFAELAKGVDAFGNNISLTDEEYEEFWELNNKLAELFPELDLGLDSNGNHILALSYSVDTLTDSINSLIEAERQAANLEIAGNLGDALKNMKSADKEYDKEINALQARRDAYDEAYSEINRMYAEQDKYKEAYGERWEDNYQLDTSNYVHQMQQAWGDIGDPIYAEAWQQMIEPFTDPDDIGKIDWHGVINSDEFTSAMAVLDRQIDAQESKKSARWQKLNPIMGAWLQTTDEYASSSDNVQAVLSRVIGNLDYSEIGITKEKKLKSYVEDNFVKPIYDAAPEVQNALVGLYDIKAAFDAGALTVGEYGITDYILGDLEKAGLNDEILSNVKLSLNLDEFNEQVSFVKSGLNEMRSEYSDTIDYYNEIQTEIKGKNIDTTKTVFGNIDTNSRQVLEWTEENIEKYREAIVSWGQSTDDLLGSTSTVFGGSESFDGVEIAYSPILQTADGPVLLDADTVHNYISSVLQKAKADGEWTNEELLLLDAEGLEVDGRRIQGLIADIGDTAIATGEAMHYVGEDGALNGTYKELQEIASSLGISTDELIAKFGSVDDYVNSLSSEELKIAYELIEENGSMTIDELQEKLKELRYEGAQMVTPLDFSSMAEGLDATAKNIDKVVSAMEKLAKGTALSKSELVDLISQYPQLLEQANLFADGSVKAQQDALNAILGLKEDEYDAQIDAKIAELKATQQVLDDQLALEAEKANLINEIKNLEVNGKITQEEDFVNKLSEYNDLQGRNYVALADGEVKVNEEALNDKLTQEYDYGDAATENIWEPLGETIVTSHEQGYTGALTATNNYTSSLWTRIKDFFSNIGTAISNAWSDMWAGNWQGIGTYFAQATSTGTQSISGGTVTVNFGGEETTVDGQNVSDWVSAQEEATANRIAQIEDIKAKTTNAINNLEKLKGLNLTELYASTDGYDSSSSNKVKEYVADIDAYYDALKRLESIQLRLADLEKEIEYADTEEEKIELTKQLIALYRDEADAISDLNTLRQQTIESGADKLRSLGFEVTYDSEANQLYIANMEHLNELQATTAGEYDTLQEATNAFREDTETLIETMEELNTANQEGASSLLDLRGNIKTAKETLVEYLNEMVSAASDVVDTFQSVYDALHQAADEYAAGGYVTIDTLQSIISMGTEYMQYLMDENGQLVINEERINAVIAAKTQQLALDNALAYVERLRLALNSESLEELNSLLFATTATTNATWGLVYAQLGLLGLNSEQYQAALHNINAIRSMADSAISGIGQSATAMTDELNDMKAGVDDILQYVMDMLKQRVNDQIEALEQMKEAYQNIIDLRKEALEAAEEEADYQDEVAKKVKEIAKLQERINLLSLDDSRDAQAQKAQLEEEMYELQTELADKQSDYAVDAQKEALDSMAESYQQEKDKEIEILEDSISSYQKLYDMAIAYIENNWDTLYSELISWNTQYGTELNSTLTTAWENALAAAQRYGSYVNALGSIDEDIENASGSGSNYIVGETNYDNSSSNEDMIHAIIKEMYANSRAHHSADTEGKAYLNKRNLTLGAMLAQYGITAVRGNDGVWYVGRVGGEELYKKYKQYIYHKGGVAGDEPTLKQNEILSVLEKGEVILDARKESSLFRLIDFMTVLSDKFDKLIDTNGYSNVFGGSLNGAPKAGDLVPINESQNQSVQFGDVYIYGTPEETVEKHREINREFTNEVLKQLNIKR